MLHNYYSCPLRPTKHNRTNNQGLSLGMMVLLLLLPVIASGGHTGQLQELAKITLVKQDQSYYLPISINHHSVRLGAQLQAGRSWMKEALCKMCDLGTEQCSDSCFHQKDEARISCDSSFCSSHAAYSDESRGISGKEVEMFVKINDGSQMLMPLVLADKLYKQQNGSGEFHLFDEETSFNHAFLTRSPSGSLELINAGKKEDVSQLGQKEGKRVNISMKGEEFDFSEVRVNKVIIHNVDDNDEKFADFEDEQEMEINFSLQQPYITFPLKLAKKMEKYINQLYLSGKKCKLLPRKLKCSNEIQMYQLFGTLIHFQIEEQLLALPFHLLVTGCSSNQCSTLIHFEQSPHAELTIGTVFWQLYNLEYTMDKKLAIFHRRNTQFDDLFQHDTLRASKKNFLGVLALLVFHAIKFVFTFLFWLALLSLLVNLVLRWREVAQWCKKVLLRKKEEKVAHTEEQFEERSLRRISKVVDPFEDSQKI